MKSSQVVGVSSGQKCSGNESGWTMYIGSQICNNEEKEDHNSDIDDKSNENENKPTNKDDYDDDDDESDDSMASDASSGPIEQANLDGTKELLESEVFGGLFRNTTVVDNNNNIEQEKYLSGNNKIKACKQVKKVRDERRVVRIRSEMNSNDHIEQHNVAKADSAESQV